MSQPVQTNGFIFAVKFLNNGKRSKQKGDINCICDFQRVTFRKKCIFAAEKQNGMEKAFITKQKDGGYRIKVSVVQFKEDGVCIVYCPALDLSGYGYSDKEARQSFKTVLLEYIRYADNKGTLNDDLKAHGWVRTKPKSPQMIPPAMTDLLATNENFNRIFNTQPSYRKYDMPMQVALC